MQSIHWGHYGQLRQHSAKLETKVNCVLLIASSIKRRCIRSINNVGWRLELLAGLSEKLRTHRLHIICKINTKLRLIRARSNVDLPLPRWIEHPHSINSCVSTYNCNVFDVSCSLDAQCRFVEPTTALPIASGLPTASTGYHLLHLVPSLLSFLVLSWQIEERSSTEAGSMKMKDE